MAGASLTCMATFGSGVRIGITIVTLARPPMAAPGWAACSCTEYCVAVHGATKMPPACVLRAAAGTHLTTGSMTRGFGLLQLLGISSRQSVVAPKAHLRWQPDVNVWNASFISESLTQIPCPLDRARCSFKYLPVCDAFTFMIASGVPVATTYPPASPPSGPKSTM